MTTNELKRNEIYRMMGNASGVKIILGTHAGAGWPQTGACQGEYVKGFLGKTRAKAHAWAPIASTDERVTAQRCTVCGCTKATAAIGGKTYTRFF